MSSVLDEFILHGLRPLAIPAIPATSEVINSESSENSNASRCVQNDSSKHESSEARYAYQFRLRDGEGGGTYITNAPDLAAARRELLKKYEWRLVVVTKAGAAP